jgi:hypothetical protein
MRWVLVAVAFSIPAAAPAQRDPRVGGLDAGRVALTAIVPTPASVAVAAPTRGHGVAVPTDYFPDANGDGEKTLCIVGDSIMFAPEIYAALDASLTEPDNILRCAMRGHRIGDLERVWAEVLDGGARSWPCVATRGHDAACDVAAVQIIANDVVAPTLQHTSANGFCYQRGCAGGPDRGKACGRSADCAPPGVCRDRAGPQYGRPCDIPDGMLSRRSYCTDGDHIGQCCSGVSDASLGIMCRPGICGGPGGCAAGAHVHMPCEKDTEATDCPGGTCAPWGPYGAFDSLDPDAAYTTGWCQLGSANSPGCPQGTCVRQVSRAYLAATMTRLIDAAAARTGASAVKLILLGNIDAFVGTPKYCVGGASHTHECASDANCAPPGKCKVTGTKGREAGIPLLRWFSEWLAATGRERSIPYADVGSYWRRLAPSPNAFLRDFVHPNPEGSRHIAEVIRACVTRDTSMPENTCGDLTAGETCPSMQSLPALGATSESGSDGRLDGSSFCTTGSTGRHVDTIVVHIASTVAAPPVHVQCSIYSLGESATATKVDAGCDTASTAVTRPGWISLPVASPDACMLLAHTTYGIFCNTDHAGLAWTTNGVPGGLEGQGRHAYEAGLPGSFRHGSAKASSTPWYLAVH